MAKMSDLAKYIYVANRCELADNRLEEIYKELQEKLGDGNIGLIIKLEKAIEVLAGSIVRACFAGVGILFESDDDAEKLLDTLIDLFEFDEETGLVTDVDLEVFRSLKTRRL